MKKREIKIILVLQEMCLHKLITYRLVLKGNRPKIKDSVKAGYQLLLMPKIKRKKYHLFLKDKVQLRKLIEQITSTQSNKYICDKILSLHLKNPIENILNPQLINLSIATITTTIQTQNTQPVNHTTLHHNHSNNRV